MGIDEFYKREKWDLSFDAILADFLSEPESLKKCIDFYLSSYGVNLIKEVQEKLSTTKFSSVMFIGNTYNYFAGFVPFFTILNSKNKVDFFWKNIELTEFYNFFLPQKKDDVLYIFMSKSGNAKLIKKSIDHLHLLKIDPNQIWLITNNNNADSAKKCGVIFPLALNSEVVLGTKSFQNCVFILYLISALLLKKNPLSMENKEDFYRLINNLMDFRKNWKKINSEVMNFLSDEIEYLYFISKGSSLSSAHHAALVAQSFVRIFSEGISLGHFFHGPFQIADDKFRCVMLIGDDCEKESDLIPGLIEQLTKKFGPGRVVLITNCEKLEQSMKNNTDLMTIKYECHNQALSPIFNMFILQTMFLQIAKVRKLLL